MFVKCNYMGWIWIRFFLLGIRNMLFFFFNVLYMLMITNVSVSVSLSHWERSFYKICLKKGCGSVYGFFGRIWILKNSDTVLVQAPRSKIPFKLTSLLVFIGKSLNKVKIILFLSWKKNQVNFYRSCNPIL